MKRCYLCKSQPKQGGNLSYHRFPKDIETRLLWIRKCNLNENIDDVSTLYICSKHFTVDDYVDLNARKCGGVLRLKPGAVPQTKFITNKPPSLNPFVSKQELLSADKDATNLPGTSSNLSDKKSDMHPSVSEMNVCGPICASNSSSKYRVDSLNLPARNPKSDTTISLEDECNLQSSQNPRKRKFVLPRHSGNLSAEDFATPRKAKRNYELLKNTVEVKQRQIKTILQYNRRLKKKIRSLKELLSLLRSGDLMEEAEQTIMVCLSCGKDSCPVVET